MDVTIAMAIEFARNREEKEKKLFSESQFTFSSVPHPPFTFSYFPRHRVLHPIPKLLR